jgi:hypothetical protein
MVSSLHLISRTQTGGRRKQVALLLAAGDKRQIYDFIIPIHAKNRYMQFSQSLYEFLWCPSWTPCLDIAPGVRVGHQEKSTAVSAMLIDNFIFFGYTGSVQGRCQ